MDKISRFWQECTTFEKIYCVAFSVTSIAISIIQDASFISALASITGMWCVFLVAKGNLNNFYFGAIFLSLSGMIMWQYGLYITLAIHLGFYLPMQFVGYWFWKRSPPLYQIHHEDIVMRELFPRGWLAVLIAVIIGSLIYVQFLTLFNVHYSQWDSVTLVISIVGQILTTFRFVEQWVTWLCLDIFNVIWWFLVLYPVNGDLTIAVMWAFKLVNVFYGWYTWNKLGKAQTKLVSGPYCAYEPQFTRHY